MDITGKIIKILELTSGSSARGEWKRQDFILETQEQYPRKVCISNWNDKVDLTNLENQVVKAFINIDSREFNGKWYTDVKVWKLAKEDGSDKTDLPVDEDAPIPTDAPPDEFEPADDDLPF